MMGLESATYISQLQPLNPDGADNLNQGDDHIRLVKGVLQSQFPSLGAAAVNATATELSYVSGVTSSIQTQLGLKAPIASPTFTGIPLTTTPDGTVSAQIASVGWVQTTVAGIGTLGDLVDTAVSANGTSAANTRELVDTTSGAITRTLPASPATYTKIGYKDAKAGFASNKLTIQPNTGQRIEDAAVLEAMDVTDKYAYFVLEWDGSVWRIL